MIKKIIKIILLVICIVSIFLFSSDSAEESSKKSNTIIYRVGELVVGRKLTNIEKDQAVEKFVFIVRKGAHFSIYLVLGFIVISLLKEYGVVNRKLIFYSIIFCILYAISDEVHQYFVPGRSCEVRDILIDTSGSAVGIWLYLFTKKIRRRLHE